MNTSVSPVGHNGYQQQYWQNLPVSPVLIFALSSIPGLLLPTTSVLLSKSAPLEWNIKERQTMKKIPDGRRGVFHSSPWPPLHVFGAASLSPSKNVNIHHEKVPRTFNTLVNSVEWSMTSSAVRSSAGSRSNGGEEAIDISWFFLQELICLFWGKDVRNLCWWHWGKAVGLSRDMTRVVAWSGVGPSTAAKAGRTSFNQGVPPLLLCQGNLAIKTSKKASLDIVELPGNLIFR